MPRTEWTRAAGRARMSVYRRNGAVKLGTLITILKSEPYQRRRQNMAGRCCLEKRCSMPRENQHDRFQLD